MSLLEAQGFVGGYGAIVVVRDVDLHVRPGEVVALLGPNGAGKTTTLLSLAGALPVLGGTVRFDGQPTTMPLHRRARAGLGVVTEQRGIFRQLTVAENLRVAAGDTALALRMFPELEPRLGVRAGLLSGGEQQMLALGSALGRRPRLLMADELSLGLAPMVTDRLLRAVREAADSGIGVLLVEQHVRKALACADRAYVMNRGRIAFAGAAGELTRRQLTEIEASYLALPEGEPR
jgi:ABC-type branched-subunit amino acid transport system ATPase component